MTKIKYSNDREAVQLIEFLRNHISNEEIQEILKIITHQYGNYRRLTNLPEFQNLFAEEYAPHKKQHGISWAISSAFPSNSKIANRLTVRRLEYGRGHTRPELFAHNIKLHILNKSTDFDANYLKECYALNGNGFTGGQLYCFIQFSVQHNQLIEVALCLPNENGRIVAKEILIDKPALMKIAA